MKGIKGWYNIHGVAYATQDAELRYTTKGTAVMNVRIALTETMRVDEGFQDSMVYLDTVTWGKKAEALAPLISKGTAIMIHEAKLIMDEWEDGKGEKRQKVKVKMIRLAPLVSDTSSGQQDHEQHSEVSDVEPF